MWWSAPPQSSLDFSSSLRSFWSPSTSFTWYTTSPGVAPKMDAPTMFSFEVQPFHFLSWINSNFLSKLQMFLSALPPQQKVRFWIDRKELHGNLSKKKNLLQKFQCDKTLTVFRGPHHECHHQSPHKCLQTFLCPPILPHHHEPLLLSLLLLKALYTRRVKIWDSRVKKKKKTNFYSHLFILRFEALFCTFIRK